MKSRAALSNLGSLAKLKILISLDNVSTSVDSSINKHGLQVKKGHQNYDYNLALLSIVGNSRF